MNGCDETGCQYPDICSIGRCRMKEDPRVFPPRQPTRIEVGEFHWTNGWYFKRLPEGDVRIRHQGSDVNIIIPSAEWCSIIGHLSPKGSTLPGEAYGDALKFHTRAEVKS